MTKKDQKFNPFSSQVDFFNKVEGTQYAKSDNTLESIFSLDKLKAAGIFQPKENNVSFMKSNNRYSIDFNATLDNTVQTPILSYDYKLDKVTVTMLDGFDLPLNHFIKKVEAQFDNYDFMPENGWGFMIYLDFVTNHNWIWEKNEILIIDELVTKGYLLNSIWVLLEIGVNAENLEVNLNLPISWVQKAHNYTPSYGYSIYDEAWIITRKQHGFKKARQPISSKTNTGGN